MSTKARARSISSLKAGENITLKFHGSRQFGNDPYKLDAEFVRFNEDKTRAYFHLDGDNSTTFEAYKSQNRWSYGTSAEKLSILSTND